MSVTIQDDMMAAAEAMPRRQGDAFLVALVRYGLSGEEPRPGTAWYPTFITCKDRISMSADASANGRLGAVKRWGKDQGKQGAATMADGAQPSCPSDRGHDGPDAGGHDSQSADSYDGPNVGGHDSQSAEGHDAEKSREEMRGDEERKEEDKEETRTLGASGSERNAQTAEVIAHLNAACGKRYRADAASSREIIGARLAEGFTVEDCKRVIDNMAARWLHDNKMRDYLRPETLFRRSKFEGYLNASEGAPVADWSAYEVLPEDVA